MTRKLDLRTGRTVWSAYRASIPATEPLTRDVKADVLIVGLGISGAMIAETLTGAGMSVVAIDRRAPVTGSTAATTALIQYEIDTPLGILSRKIGRDAACQVWRRSKLAVANLAATIGELDIHCDLMRRTSLYLAGDVLDADGLRAEAQARRAAGLEALFLGRTELTERFGIDRAGAILSFDNLCADPRKLAAGLLKRAAEGGAEFYAPAEAVEFSHDANEVTVSTKAGPAIRAGHVVLATGYELAKVAPAARHRVLSTYAIATRPQSRRLVQDLPLIWESADPYLYVRVTRDNRLICGGEDEPFADEERRDALISEKATLIAAKLKKLLPFVDPVPEFAWAGAFGATETGLPFIGRVPRHPRIHAVMGYGGNGITFSRIAAELIRTELTGGRDQDAAHFALDG